MVKLSLLFFAFYSLAPVNVLAAKQYRCNGRVQYRPCNQPVPNGRPQSAYSAMIRTQRNAINSNREMRAELKMKEGTPYGKIVTQSYKKLSNISGQWRGIVEGNGSLRLFLQILRNGELESSRFMGEVALKNKQTHFNFVSAPPTGPGWSWKILVFAS